MDSICFILLTVVMTEIMFSGVSCTMAHLEPGGMQQSRDSAALDRGGSFMKTVWPNRVLKMVPAAGGVVLPTCRSRSLQDPTLARPTCLTAPLAGLAAAPGGVVSIVITLGTLINRLQC